MNKYNVVLKPKYGDMSIVSEIVEAEDETEALLEGAYDVMPEKYYDPKTGELIPETAPKTIDEIKKVLRDEAEYYIESVRKI